MSRLAPLPPETTPELKSHFDFFLGTLGFTPNSVLTMQRKPKLVQAHTLLGAANFGVSEARLADVWNYATTPLEPVPVAVAEKAIGSQGWAAGKHAR